MVRLARVNATVRPASTAGQCRRCASSIAATPMPAAGHQAAVLPVLRPTTRAPTPAR